ncbi:MAG: hypothetical protein JWM80_3725 [Cyanobacteria bacterium RYN_339]|nr:hypothetical protein [Cyanobacteria bacterium RYN_339]
MPNVMGYYQTPAPVAPPAAGAPPLPMAPAPAGYQQVASWDTWKPTSNSDPYVSGMRTSGSAVAAVSGAAGMAANARFANYAAWKAGGAAKSAAMAAKSRSAIGMSSKMTKAMSTAAKNGSSGKASFMASISAGPRNAGIFSAFKNTFMNLGNITRAIGTSALISLPIAVVTNFMDWKAGRITQDQRNALIVADGVGYTVTGATSTLFAGAVGATFLGPVVGTIAGIGAGFFTGWVYEKYIRPKWGEWVHGAMYKQPVTPIVPPPVIQPPNIEPK